MNTTQSNHLELILPGLSIAPLLQKDLDAAQAHLDDLTKPQGSLGRLEDLAQKLYAISGGQTPINVSPAIMLTVAGDHGVADQGVSPFPKAVTRQMVQNFFNNGAGVNVLCKTSGMDLRVVDAGCDGGPYEPHDILIERRLGDGTADMSQGPAMSRETCLKGLRMGVELAQQLADEGYRCLGVGEMGIANSTAGTALYCSLLNLSPEQMTGPGAGANADMVRHKTEIVRKALAVNEPMLRDGDPINTLAAVGGYEIVLMAGLMLGAASRRLPVLVDGFICSAAYVAALQICPQLADYAVLSHASAEPGHVRALSKLTGGESRNNPLLHLSFRLGEGTGGAVAYHLLRCAAAMYNDMATFSSAGVAGKTC